MMLTNFHKKTYLGDYSFFKYLSEKCDVVQQHFNKLGKMFKMKFIYNEIS